MTELKMSIGTYADNRCRLDSFSTAFSGESTDAPGNLTVISLESSFNELLIKLRDFSHANSEPTTMFQEPSATEPLSYLPNWSTNTSWSAINTTYGRTSSLLIPIPSRNKPVPVSMGGYGIM